MVEAPTETIAYTCECCGRVGDEMWGVWTTLGTTIKYYVCKDVKACNARRPALAPTP